MRYSLTNSHISNSNFDQRFGESPVWVSICASTALLRVLFEESAGYNGRHKLAI